MGHGTQGLQVLFDWHKRVRPLGKTGSASQTRVCTHRKGSQLAKQSGSHIGMDTQRPLACIDALGKIAELLTCSNVSFTQTKGSDGAQHAYGPAVFVAGGKAGIYPALHHGGARLDKGNAWKHERCAGNVGIQGACKRGRSASLIRRERAQLCAQRAGLRHYLRRRTLQIGQSLVGVEAFTRPRKAARLVCNDCMDKPGVAQHRLVCALNLAVKTKGRVGMHRRLVEKTQVRAAQGKIAQSRARQVSVAERLLHL